MDKARRIVKQIEADLLDRRGLKWAWEDVSPAIKTEIRKTWADIIRRELAKT